MESECGFDLAAYRLTDGLDRTRLAADLDRLEQLVRQAQPGPYHNGSWAGVALHAAGGQQSAAPGFPGLEPYCYTPAAEHAPYLKDVLGALGWPLQVVRVLWLPPGEAIKEHYDFDISFAFGLARLHIPLATNSEVEFLVGGHRIPMQPGELWYADFSLPHSVFNRGATARVHAVIDTELSPEVLQAFPPALVARKQAEGAASMPRAVLPAPAGLSRLTVRFTIPREVLPLLVMGRLADFRHGMVAELRSDDAGLLLLLEGRPHCRLLPVGPDEFTILGLPSGCLVRLDRQGDTVAAVTLVIRGVQSDLAAARLGVVRGPPIAEQQYRFLVQA